MTAKSCHFRAIAMFSLLSGIFTRMMLIRSQDASFANVVKRTKNDVSSR